MKQRPPTLSIERLEDILDAAIDNGPRLAAIWCFLKQEHDGFVDHRTYEIAEGLRFTAGSTGRKYVSRLKEYGLLREATRGEGRKDRRDGFEFAIKPSGGRRW